MQVIMTLPKPGHLTNIKGFLSTSTNLIKTNVACDLTLQTMMALSHLGLKANKRLYLHF